MISFTLKCSKGHTFDSWFQSASAFEKLQSNGMVCCAVCDCTKIEKAIMAPSVAVSRTKTAHCEAQAPSKGALSKPANPTEQMIAELKRKVERDSDYVGENFAAEARAMHDGDAPERSIYGEAKVEDAKKLIEDGVPVLPLPFGNTRKTN